METDLRRVTRVALVLVALFALAPPAAASERIIAGGLSQPVFLTAPPGDPRLFVVEKGGRIELWDGSQLLPTPFLDIRDRVDDAGGIEGGMLGLAFPDDYAQSGVFYVYYTTTGSPLTSRISRFRVSAGDPNVAAPDEKILLTLDQPFDNHDGGTLAFGPDGYLYMGFGDGGLGGDPFDSAQRGDTLLGKMIRIDVSHQDFFDDYTIPADNPFVGDPTVRDEIWALGLRNPYRFSFDRATGDLYIADVGQSEREEIDVEPAPDPGGANPGGRNYGWDVMEGTLCYSNSSPSDPDPDPFELPCNDPSFTLPIHEYGHTMGRCSVTGGVVVRSGGDLDGEYLFGDFCSGEVWSLVWDGAGGTVGPVLDRTSDLAPDVGSINSPVAFGEGGDGSVYLVDFDGDVFLVPEPGRVALFAVGALVLVGAAARARMRRA